MDISTNSIAWALELSWWVHCTKPMQRDLSEHVYKGKSVIICRIVIIFVSLMALLSSHLIPDIAHHIIYDNGQTTHTHKSIEGVQFNMGTVLYHKGVCNWMCEKWKF